MDNKNEDASDGSVQEIAVTDRNPIASAPVASPAGEADNNRGIQMQDGPADQQPDTAAALLTDKQEASTAPAKIQTGMVRVELLRPYAKNSEIYQDREDPLFTESIRKNGVLTDLVVTGDGETLGGNRRLREAKRLGLLEVPVKVVVCKTEDEKMLRVLDDNVQRAKSKEELTREYVERLKVEARAAAQRKVEAGRKPKGQTQEVEKVTPPVIKKGKARDEAAKALNLSGVTAEKGRKVLEAVAKARAQNAAETADELLVILNDKGFHAAFKRAQVLKLIVPALAAATKRKTTAMPAATAPAVPEANDVAVVSAAVPTAPAGCPVTPSAIVAPQPDGGSPQVTTMEPEEDDDDSEDRIATDYIKAAVKLARVMAENLTLDLRRNLLRAQDDAQEWFAYNDEALNEQR